MTTWGIIGTGDIATRFVRTIADLDGAVVGGVVSRTAARADEFAAEFGIPGRFTTLQPLFDAADVVYVATPHDRHRADTLAALQAGMPVLCEKPLAINHRQGKEMVDAARAASVFLMEAVWSRFLPWFDTLVRHIASGVIGEVRSVQSDFGFVIPHDPDSRLLAPRHGGGSLLDIGIYPLTLVQAILGWPDEVRAWAHLGDTGVDEQIGVVLGYSGGRLGVVHASLQGFNANEATIVGTDGYIRLRHPAHATRRLEVHRQGKPPEVDDTSFPSTGMQFEVEEVHRCLAAGEAESPRVPHDHSLRMLQLMDLIRAEVGLRYPVDD